MFRIAPRLFCACLIVLLLTACSNPLSGELPGLQMPAVQTTVDGDGTAYAVAFLMFDSAAPLATATSLQSMTPQLSEGELSQQSLTEVESGVYLGMFSDVDSAGNTTFELPEPEDIPSGTLVNASDAFQNGTAGPDCSVNADPATVQVTVNAFELMTIPGFVGLISTPSSLSELVFAVMGDRFVDLNTLPSSFLAYQWIYSDGETVVSFEGSDCGSFSASQVDFQEGWNLVGWEVDGVAGTAELVNVEEPETIFLTIQGETPPL